MPKKSKAPKKDYAYRSTWKHKFSRARNLAQRGGLTKAEMKKKHGRFPRKSEWWGVDGSYQAWKMRWVAANPPPKSVLLLLVLWCCCSSARALSFQVERDFADECFFVQVPEPAFELGLDFEVMPRYRGAGGGGAGCRDGTGKAACGTIDVAVRSPDGDAIRLISSSAKERLVLWPTRPGLHSLCFSNADFEYGSVALAIAVTPGAGGAGDAGARGRQWAGVDASPSPLSGRGRLEAAVRNLTDAVEAAKAEQRWARARDAASVRRAQQANATALFGFITEAVLLCAVCLWQLWYLRMKLAPLPAQ